MKQRISKKKQIARHSVKQGVSLFNNKFWNDRKEAIAKRVVSRETK